MLEEKLQMNLPPEAPGHASLKYELSLFLVMYVIKTEGMKIKMGMG